MERRHRRKRSSDLLYKTVQDRKISMIRSYLKKCVRVNTYEKNRRNIWHWNAYKGNGKTTRYLLSCGCKIDSLDYAGRSALHLAVAAGNASVARCLLMNGASIQMPKGRCPLETAMASPRTLEIAKMILDFEKLRHGEVDEARLTRALHAAIDSTNIKAVELLISYGAPVNSIENGLSCLDRVFTFEYAENEDLLKVLLDAGADVNGKNKKNGKAPIHVAVIAENVSLVKMLLLAGANVNSQDQQLATALHYAIYRKDKHMVAFLLDNGANVSIRTSDGDTSLHIATRRNVNFDIIEGLLLYGADVNALNKNQQTPTHFVAESGCEKLLKIFQENGADLNAKDRIRRTMLHYAVFNTDNRVFRSIVDSGVDVNARSNEDTTALHLAAKESKTEYIRFLIERGADVSVKDVRLFIAQYYTIVNCCSYVDGKIVEVERTDPDKTFPGRGPEIEENLAENKRILRFLTREREVKIINPVVDQLIINELKGIKIKDDHAKLIMKHDDVREYYEDRKIEFQALMKKKIFCGISLFDFFTDNTRKLSRYIKNEEFANVIEYCLNEFPAYYSQLKMKLEESMKMRILIDDASVVLADIFQFENFNHIICHEILSKMDTQDIRLLISS